MTTETARERIATFCRDRGHTTAFETAVVEGCGRVTVKHLGKRLDECSAADLEHAVFCEYVATEPNITFRFEETGR